VVIQRGLDAGFLRMRDGYRGVLEQAVGGRRVFAVVFFAVCLVSMGLVRWVGEDFFPSVDSGQFKIHLRAHTGTRIEDVASLCDQVDRTIRELIPPDELVTIIDNVGLPYSGINTTYSNSAPIGPADADIQVSLAAKHRPTPEYVQRLREELHRRFPGVTFYELPVDIVTQILNFGLPAPLDIQVVGNDLAGNRAWAERVLDRVKTVAGTADLRIQQPFDAPALKVEVDRTKALQMGLSQRDVATSLLTATSGSFQTAPSFWLNPQNGVSYNIAVQAPQYAMDSLQGLQNIPLAPPSTAAANSAARPNAAPASAASGGSRPTQILSNVASISRGSAPGTVSHYNIAPAIDIFGNVVGTDLASVDAKIERIIDAAKKDLPRGSRVFVRGQVQTMRSSFRGLVAGLVFSIVLVYLLIVVNFQSWLDPFIIIAALPFALAGVVWFLFVTATRISVPALTGTIMCMGVATSNSILVVSFAREQLAELRGDARAAALSAGFVRFRPVLMTALAMIIGMVPMALGLGDGGEQNAPLGRAVIGGLLFATVSTLFFVPTFFHVLHGWLEGRRQRREGGRRAPAVSGDLIHES
ncbi:MAG TPA: efflux RND transporter permease subunit, partial [Polyangia bacterium]|nr:efflux RND transporter permease subunit [Polyangia bacterium]